MTAKKMKKTKRPRKPISYAMVIRVSIPAQYVPAMKALRVLGTTPGRIIPHDLEILSAYYDKEGQPNACMD